MANGYTEQYTCPICGTRFKAIVITGIQPFKTKETIECPVCGEEVDHKNITGDIECEVISLENTIEPYKSDYLKRTNKTL